MSKDNSGNNVILNKIRTSLLTRIIYFFLITCTLSSIAEASATVTMSFQDGVEPDASYAGTSDTVLVEDQPDTSFGASTSLFVDGDEPKRSGKDVSSILRWDISTIPPGSVIESVEITVEVTNATSGAYGVYEMLVPWNEAQASWNESAPGTSWQTAGAAGLLDRGSVELGVVSASELGRYTLSLNSNGIAAVQVWVDNPDSNHGLIIADSSITNGMDISSRETAVAVDRPKLTITYSAPTQALLDSDGDGVPDSTDAFPLDPTESMDTDNDGIGDNADADDDNDGVADAQDVFPSDPTEWSDADADGTGDNADPDDDNDGIPDVWELQYGFDPLDPSDASQDADGDGSSNLQEYLQGTSPLPVDILSSWDTTPIQQELSTVTVGEKPQSKVWKYDGKWWLVMPDITGVYYVWRLDADVWTRVLVLDAIASNAQADTLIHTDQNGIVHVLLSAGSQTRLVSLEYVSGSPGSYQLWSERPASVNVRLSSSAEIATLTIDSKGKMWIASDATTTIEVRHSDFPYVSWSSPITLASGISYDDISSIIKLNNNSIGVMWSNQQRESFGFRVHIDSDNPEDWSADEVPASQSELNIGNGMADDHINLAATSGGDLYAAVKTSYDTSRAVKIALLKRKANGTWDDIYTVDTKGTRPIVVINEAYSILAVIYSSDESGGDVLYRESQLYTLDFGSIHKLIDGGSYTNVSSLKEAFTDDLVIIASETLSDGKVNVDSVRLQR